MANAIGWSDALKIHNALHAGKPGSVKVAVRELGRGRVAVQYSPFPFVLQGQTCVIEETKRTKCWSTKVNGITFMTQNKSKDSEYAKVGPCRFAVGVLARGC
jgi:hypothetical protein